MGEFTDRGGHQGQMVIRTGFQCGHVYLRAHYILAMCALLPSLTKKTKEKKKEKKIIANHLHNFEAREARNSHTF